MATSINARPAHERFLGNSSPSKLEVHDLQSEQANCQIEELLSAGHGVVFSPDTLEQARSEGYDPCHWCLAGSTR